MSERDIARDLQRLGHDEPKGSILRDALLAAADEIERLREMAGITRLCVSCGRTVDAAKYKRGDTIEGCPSGACCLDLTPREAADHWSAKAHDLMAEITRLQIEIISLRAMVAASPNISTDQLPMPEDET